MKFSRPPFGVASRVLRLIESGSISRLLVTVWSTRSKTTTCGILCWSATVAVAPAVQYAADRLAEQTRRIVFVDAWVLRDGEAINDVMPAQFVESSVLAAKESADQTVAMDPQVWAEHFMNSATEHDIATVTNKLVPVPFGWLSEPVSLPGFWGAALPSSYVFLRQDLAVPQEIYRAMAGRLDQPRVVDCDGPHEAMLTHPDLVAAALIDAAPEQL
jgi:hypothetical protein